MTELHRCQQCGIATPSDAVLGGGCPTCMLAMAFETRSESFALPELEDCHLWPEVIGRYRIVRLIGEGGMGSVYEAEQDHPRRTVALKIIRPDRAAVELLRRFKQESLALGRMQHPGIAQIYEVGTVNTGFGPQPYFAMEFIRGRSPQDYFESQHRNTRERLEIMAKICDAVHHAHQKGLIHRDLKPANILVDETGQPKILDFGVSRITDSDAKETSQTDVGQLIGTLAYMSPEQTCANSFNIDSRSDIYALGVILYELLTGHVPYPIGKSLHENIQMIREKDPTPLGAWNRTFRGDIETIVAKALEKNKARRYGSAAEMGTDIRRYLRNEPIVARPPSATYQLKKLAQRNKKVVSGITAVFLVIAAATVTTSRLVRMVYTERNNTALARAEARRQRDRADANENKAKDESKRALATGQLVRELDHGILAGNRAVLESANASELRGFAGYDSLGSVITEHPPRTVWMRPSVGLAELHEGRLVKRPPPLLNARLHGSCTSPGLD